MRTITKFGVALIVVAAFSAGAIRTTACGGNRLEMWAMWVVAEDESVRQQAIEGLRKAGPDGLNALLDTYTNMIAQHGATTAKAITISLPPDQEAAKTAIAQAEQEAKIVDRVKVALDAVGGQKDNFHSRLFWYTDLEQAKAAAKASGKPILSLRLLGKLTDDLSCANSRFFRTILYPNVEINSVLREKYILHWETFREVPIVTIDFGNGRKIVRTLTGNSIHYVLDTEGRPIEAIPGLYGPPAFLRQLKDAATLHDTLAKAEAKDRDNVLRATHAKLTNKIDEDLKADQNRIRKQRPNIYGKLEHGHVYVPEFPEQQTSGWSPTLPEPTLEDIATLPEHQADAKLDAAGVAVVKEKAPDALAAGRLAIFKGVVEAPWMKMVRNLQQSLTTDTVTNEYNLHRKIHAWFQQGKVPANLHDLNEKVYAELFLMPSTDPWLGLSTPDQFSGVTGGGLIDGTATAVEMKH